MNRRQILFGAGATALLFSGFAAPAQASGAVSMSISFAPFDQGIRGSYTLNGLASLVGSILPVPPLPMGAAAPAGSPMLHGSITQGSAASAQPAADPTPAAPPRAPSMSIVRVPKGSARPVY